MTTLTDNSTGVDAPDSPALAGDDNDSGPIDENTEECREYATWPSRAVAYLVDMVVPIASIVVLALIATVADGCIWIVLPALVAVVLVAVAILANTVFRQGKTGQTLGKMMVDIRIVQLADNAAPGIGRALFHEVAKVLNTVPLFIGWLWPLRDNCGQTFADKLANTAVVRDTRPTVSGGSRVIAERSALGIYAVLALVLVGLTATQYAFNYRRDQVTEQIQSNAAQIASQATVALLSYKPDTVAADLTAASSRLTGDFLAYYTKYTKDVVIPTAVQEKVNTQAEAAGAALVSADHEHATVLVFINQTTTSASNQQPDKISSTVRVDLVKVGTTWLVSQFAPI